MILGFTGTRNGMTAEQKLEVCRLISVIKPTMVVHGDCLGADAQFDAMAHGINAAVVTRPCNIHSMRAHCKAWKEYPEEEPLARNRKIVDDSNTMIATPKSEHEELRSGTWTTIRYATGKRMLFIIYPSGRIEVREVKLVAP